MAIKTTANLRLPLATLGDSAFKRSFKAAMALIDAAVGRVLTGSKTHDFASILVGAQATTTVTVPDAALGDFVTGVSLGVDAAGLRLSGYVSAVNTVTVVARNDTGGAVDLASTTLRVLVRKA
ncbi:hypothetical protein [Novosphingobium resinovorum]|uniref:Uncharacterized protein n=1 Tax=Novosphingobium resinovorum TaxID=158500 RepID=A0A1D8A360_9SPHN|nr:hypothetical protein [Novosphingobium resinovorum]AOR76555.1 hypothetical protein BES08_07195 [Novosphingobium resinovorum]